MTASAGQPVYSMTGFARVAGQAGDGMAWTLTLKSVNHRFFDPHMRMPAGTEAIEMHLRRLLKEQVSRGHVEVALTVERSGKREVRYDPAVVEGYLAAFRAAAAAHGLKQEPDLNVIFGMPEVFGGSGQAAAQTTEMRAAGMAELERSVMEAAQSAVEQLKTMRAQEGAALAAELQRLMAAMAAHVKEVAQLHAGLGGAHHARLKERIGALLGSATGTPVADRLLTEAALLAERSDVTEELARLEAHIAQFAGSVRAGGELGKKLDFLLQEMNREANTLLSKMAGVGGDGTKVTELGLRMKSDIEKAREQVQNIE